MRVPLLVVLAFALTIHMVLLPLQTGAQVAKPRSIAFFGRVESVDSERKVVTVKHGKIAGYMDSATTDFSVDEPGVLNRLRPADNIRATVYPNDLTLHQIHVVYRSAGDKTFKK
jgi:Cu/Ag efflux protein CusF